MGRIRKQHSLTFDMSSTENAPVAPSGALRVRPKVDGTTLQLSYNTGAYFDMGSGSASGSVRLDQVLDPDLPAPPASTQVKTFEMGNHQLVYHFSGTEAEESFVIESVTGTGSGPILLLRASGATTTKSPLRIEARGAFAFSVAADGKVAIGAETGLVHKLNVYHTNTGGTNIGAIHGLVTLGSGNTAVSMSGSELTTTDAGNTTALLAMKNLELNLQRETSAIANGFMVGTILSANAEINIFTGTVRGLTLGIGVHNSATVSTWEAIRITAPSTFGGGIVETKRAIITEAGAGYTGLGTLTPTVQLHVAGAMHDEQSTGQVFTIAKTTDSETPQLDFKATHVTGLYLDNGSLAGRIMFYGWFSPAWKALGYVHSTFDTTFGNAGKIEIGAGDFNNARVEILQTDTGTGGVTIRGATTTPWFSVNSAGHLFSHGTTGSLYYRDSAGYFVNLDIDADPTGGTDEGKVLTVTNVSGTLYPRWMTAVGGTPGTGEPALPASTLQYNNAGAFGAVSNSVVSGANVTLGGSLTIRNGASSADQNILLDAVSTNPTRLIFTDYRDAATGSQITWERGRLSGGVHTDLTTNNVIARFLWKGQIPTTGLTQLAFMHGYYTTDYGSSAGVLELGAGGFTLARIFILQGTGVGSNGGVTIYGGASSPFFQVQTAGFQFSGSTNGAMWYTNSFGYFVPTASPTSFDSIPYWDNSEGKVAYMTIGNGLSITGIAPNQVLTAIATGGTPAGTGSELQYRNAGAFGAVGTSGVTAAGWVGLGTTTPSLRLHVVGGCVLEAASFIFQVQTAGFYFSSGSTGSVYYKDTFGYFVPTASGTSNQYLKGGSAPSWSSLTATGSGTELQCRDSGTGSFGAVANSSVDGSGGIVLGGGALTVQSNASVTFSMKAANASTGATVYTERSRGTLTSKSGVLAGDALLTLASWAYYDSVNLRQGVAVDFTAQATFSSTSAPTVLRLRTTPVNSVTPAGRMIIGACRTLANNTLTDLFSITFGTADQMGMGGEIHMVFVAKQVSPVVHTHVFRRIVSFIIGHNANNDALVNFRELTAGQASAASNDSGFVSLSHAINSDAAVSIGTNIPTNPNLVASNTITYRVLADALNAGAGFTTLSQLTCYYNIFYHGEGELAVAAS